MKVYSYVGFTGYWPVGTSAVIVARDKVSAIVLLDKKLSDIGLTQNLNIEDLKEINIDCELVYILNDGNY